jgi:hypothetical protein
MSLFAVHCRLCGGTRFKPDPARGWLETYVLPRFLIFPGRCTACLKRRYCPVFQPWDKSEYTFP